MRTLKTTTIVSAAFLSLLLSACGGGAGSPLDSSGTGNTATTDPSKIGRGDGSNFVDGEIAVSHTSAELVAGGTTTLSVSIVSNSNTLVTAPVQVTFNSRCYAAGEATLASGTTSTNKVSTDIGQARITYTAKGCVGDDEITATAILGDVAKVARVTIKVAQDTVQSIRFMEATPDKIFLKDSGGVQTSAIRFQVLGNTNAPIKDAQVNFSLSTTAGGIQLTASSAVSNSQGYVSTTVQAGTIPTAVEVIAVNPATNVSARSNKLSIGTGIPDQNSMSISASRFNPPGWNRDGEEVSITIRLADAFNNPPPDGTSVAFTTEGGVIAPNCVTTNGACSVVWKSQNSRPNNGRVTILATTVGNESFIDVNANGQYDAGDIFNTYNTPNVEGDCNPNVPTSTAESNGSDSPCDDLGEAYVDKNENGTHDNNEEFVDFNLNKTHNTENGMYNGVLCKDGENCTKEPVNIREDIVISMSSDMPYSENGLLIGQPEVIEMGANESYSFTVTLADVNGNAMPVGTTVSLITTTASDVTINHNMPSGGVPNTLSPTSFSVTLKGSKTERPSGSFGIAIKSPYLETVFTTRIAPKPLENTTALYMGKGSGASFTSGAIELGIGDAVLAPNGTTSLSVNLVDEDRNLTSGAAEVTFTSACIRAGTATLTDAAGEETTTASTQTGRATIVYTANGCMGEDEITATSNVPSLLVNTATAIITITEVSAQSIRFDSATPSLITLKGTGSDEVSQVVFTVVGPDGLALAGVPVTLKLNNTLGGVCIVDASLCKTEVVRVSDGTGKVTAVVQSGSIATSVRVTATASSTGGGTISTQSSRLVVSTGIPDQDSMSISASEHNPPTYVDGYEVDVVIRMADAFNNPVPEGTAVYFTTSGGLIDDLCYTEADSSCTVTWRSQNPRPSNGRINILATALGNESFIDTNGNGTYDTTDTFSTSGNCAPNTPVPSAARSGSACDDLGEAYLDSNWSGTYTLIDGYFADIFGADGSLGGDGTRNGGNGKYDGILCPLVLANLGNCTRNTVSVREDLQMVLSTGIPDTNSDGLLIGQPGNVTLALDESELLSITLQDTNENSLPTGTTVTIDDGDLVNATVFINPDPVEVASNVTGATNFTVSLKGDPALAASGSFKIVVEVPEKQGVVGSTRSYTTTIN